MQERTEVGRPKPEDEGQHSRLLRAEPTPRAEVVNTFDLLSGWGGPSSLPSALRGRGSLDSPGVIISARPIGANRKQEKQLSMTMFGFARKQHASCCKIVAQRLSHLCPVIPCPETWKPLWLKSGNKRERTRREYKYHATTTTTTTLQSKIHSSCCWCLQLAPRLTATF